MPIQQQLLDLGDLFHFSDLSTFIQNIPGEWVASAEKRGQIYFWPWQWLNK